MLAPEPVARSLAQAQVKQAAPRSDRDQFVLRVVCVLRISIRSEPYPYLSHTRTQRNNHYDVCEIRAIRVHSRTLV